MLRHAKDLESQAAALEAQAIDARSSVRLPVPWPWSALCHMAMACRGRVMNPPNAPAVPQQWDAIEARDF